MIGSSIMCVLYLGATIKVAAFSLGTEENSKEDEEDGDDDDDEDDGPWARASVLPRGRSLLQHSVDTVAQHHHHRLENNPAVAQAQVAISTKYGPGGSPRFGRWANT